MAIGSTSGRGWSCWPRRLHVLVAAVGAITIVTAGLVVRSGRVHGAEARLTRAINHAPDGLYPWVWAFQQFGNLVVAFVLTAGAALALRRPKVAGLAAGAVVGKLVFERVVKELVHRERPATSFGDIVLRGDVSASGLAFVSGHAIITTAMAAILTPILPRRWKPVPWILVALNGLTRVYVGAHGVLDVVGGIGVGLAIGGLLNATQRCDDPAGTTEAASSGPP